MSRSAFEILFAFASQTTALVEVRRLDLPADAPVAEIYHWLVVGTDAVQTLTFVSMEQAPRQHRVFREGELWFDQHAAHLVLDGQGLDLPAGDRNQMPVRWLSRIEAHFAAPRRCRSSVA